MGGALFIRKSSFLIGVQPEHIYFFNVQKSGHSRRNLSCDLGVVTIVIVMVLDESSRDP